MSTISESATINASAFEHSQGGAVLTLFLTGEKAALPYTLTFSHMCLHHWSARGLLLCSK